MIIIQHRVNEVAKLLQTPKNLGVEVDIRSDRNQLYLAHDPFISGTPFIEYLDHFDHAFIVLNVKEEGLEQKCLDLLNERGIKDYFFLDQSYPSIRKMIASGNSKLATRVSDFEDLETALNSGSDWVWLDSFSGNWRFLQKAVPAIKENKQKVCLVSPELQRTDSDGELLELQGLIKNLDTEIDAVCTKFPKKWAL